MQIRTSKMKWVVLSVGMFLMAATATTIHAESWFTFRSSKGKTSVSDEKPGAEVPPPDDGDDDAPAPDSAARAPSPKKSAPTNVTTAQGQAVYAAQGAECYATNCPVCGGRARNGYCPRCCQRCACYRPVNPWYCDPRDMQIYAAQGYNVPVTVPLAPMVQTYNYGWGIPSSRLSAAGNYMSWHPAEAYSLSGRGRLPAVYPVVNRPTDTTQLGYYYNYVPEWQPRW